VKKKLLSFILVMFMCVSVLTGCSLVTQDDAKYYEATVATIKYVDGDKDVIKKQDLITAYSSYGYNYVQNYGYDLDKTIELMLDNIISQKITIKAVEDYYANLDAGDLNKDVVLNGNETTYLWDATFEAIYSNLQDYFYEIIEREELGTETEAEANKSLFVDYKSDVEIVDGLILKKTAATTIRETYEGRKVGGEYIDFEVASFKDQMYDQIVALASDSSNTTKDKQWKAALRKYINVIKENYSYKKFANDKAVVMFELDRVYNILKDNYMVEKYEVIFNTAKHQDAKTSNVTIKDVLELYTAKVKTDYAAYTAAGGKTTFESDILSDRSKVDYILETKDLNGETASNYFSVAYVKLSFDEETQAELDRINAKKEAGGYSRIEDYNADVEAVYSSVYAKVRSSTTGEETGETVYAYDKNGQTGLLSQIRAAINAYSYADIEDEETTTQIDFNTQVAYDKADAFRKYLYLYNDDDTLKGADYNTVFGINAAGEVLAKDTFSSNDDVKAAIKTLYKNGDAKIGDTSDIVRAEDGVYIFFFAGNVENIFTMTSNFDLASDESNIKYLTSTRLNIFSSKTIFDSLYETLTTDNFSVYKNMDMNALRQRLVKGEIEIIENNIKTL